MQALTYRSVPKSAAKLNGLEQDRLSLLESHVRAQTVAHAHGTKADAGHRDVGERECLDHFEICVDDAR